MAGFGSHFGRRRFGMESDTDETGLTIPSAWLLRFYSDFQLPPSMTRLPRNGTLTENKFLTAALASGAAGDWWVSACTAPIAYRRIVGFSFDTVFKFEARCIGLTYTNNNVLNLMALYNDTQNVYWMGWYPGNTAVYSQRGISNSFGDLTYHTGKSSPSVAPHTYRMYVNPTSRSLYIIDGTLATTIDADEIQFWYRVNDSGSWVNLHNRTMELSLNSLYFGLGIRNWATPYPAVSATWTHAFVGQWSAEKQRMLPIQKQVSLK